MPCNRMSIGVVRKGRGTAKRVMIYPVWCKKKDQESMGT